MPDRLTEDVLRDTLATVAAHPTKVSAAAALGISTKGLDHRLHMAALRGLMGTRAVLPGFALKETSERRNAEGEVEATWVRQVREPGAEFETPEGHVVKGVSALLDPDGRELLKWVKTREGVLDPLALADRLKEAFADFRPPKRAAVKRPAADDDLLTLLPFGDWHIGMYAWGREAGENWDLQIAERVIGDAAEAVIARSARAGEGIVLIGGDLLHADNKDNQTARSGAKLDVDGRYQKVLLAATGLMVRTVDAALRRYGRVTVRVLSGNHDEHSATAVAYFLSAWYRGEERVIVDLDPSLFFWRRFGFVMLGATHGHTVKLSDMPAIMAHRRAEDWGATRFRYVHGFHLHRAERIATEGNGVIAEIHRAPVPKDAWHFGSGYLSGRSLQAITYHREFGEVGRTMNAILDGAA